MLAALAVACSRGETEREEAKPGGPAPRATSAPAPRASSSALEILHLPDADELLPPPIGGGFLPGAPRHAGGRCPADMVDVRGAFCIDRYEVTLTDARSGGELSPFYHPARAQTQTSYARYRRLERTGRALPAVPEPPVYQLETEVEPRARAVANVIPQGYLSGDAADAACRMAGKRLCSLSEWVAACRGQQNRKYPYGDKYADGACNVFREAHPAALVHGDASREHLDPRLNLVASDRGPLLRRTGATPGCRSEWGADAVFDMVGNLDEWVEEGSFSGGFYSRATREGCDARITTHPRQYFDYSLGARCCR